MLPKDPAILLIVVNTKLRDDYADLDNLCAAEGAEQAALVKTLGELGYRYHPRCRQFIGNEAFEEI